MVIPQATVVDMLWAPGSGKGVQGNALYLLTEQGVPHNYNIPHETDRKRPAGIWRWTGGNPLHLKTFDEDLSPEALNLGRDGLLMIDATSSKNEHDIALISRDGGERWERQDEGPGAAGGYFESGGVTKWIYYANSLLSREIR